MKNGILPSQEIRTLLEQKQILADVSIEDAQIQPASLDLRLGTRAYRVRASFLPSRLQKVSDRLDALSLHEFSLEEGAVLETGCVYIVPLLEQLALPDDLSAAANPKSSTGRLDVFTRVIADKTPRFETIPAGYHGPLYAEICPQTFPILVRTGSRLSQIRFRRGPFSGSDEETRDLHDKMRLVDAEQPDIDGGIAVSVDLAGVTKSPQGEAGTLIGYRAKKHTGVVDVDMPGSCRIADFWEPLYYTGHSSLVLDPDQFYILASREAVHVPPQYAAEMVPFNPLVGEFRVHYAGFFDPGFGHAPSGGSGSRGVLEVRSHNVPFILEDGQTIARLVYEKLTQAPVLVYGNEIGSNYQSQGLKLSKHFV